MLSRLFSHNSKPQQQPAALAASSRRLQPTAYSLPPILALTAAIFAALAGCSNMPLGYVPPSTTAPSSNPADADRQYVALDRNNLPKELQVNVGPSVVMRFILVPAGKGVMGSPQSERFRNDDEGPAHEVAITRPFYIAATHVTRDQYQRVMGAWAAPDQGDLPVTGVSWCDAEKFCQKLTQRSGHPVHLPSETQWEFACRAGGQTAYCFGDDDTELPAYARYESVSAQAAGKLKPNALGLYDMHGNAWQWCQDWYGPYPAKPQSDPTGPADGKLKVIRGGSFRDSAQSLRSAKREAQTPNTQRSDVGFRVIMQCD
jgi:formylglycine-generating enzyme required for sulfatase activity